MKKVPTFAPAKKIKRLAAQKILKFFKIKFGSYEKMFYLCSPN